MLTLMPRGWMRAWGDPLYPEFIVMPLTETPFEGKFFMFHSSLSAQGWGAHRTPVLGKTPRQIRPAPVNGEESSTAPFYFF